MRVLKNKICRRFEEDIFGNIIMKSKLNKVGLFFQTLIKEKKELRKRFVYRVDLIQPRRKKNRTSQFATLLYGCRKICLFYGNIKRNDLRNIYRRVDSRGGSYSNGVVGLLESRLDTLIYRMNFATSILQSREYIRMGCIMVNKEVIKLSSYYVKPGDIIEVLDVKKDKIYNDLLFRINNNLLYTSTPKYVEVNYNILTGVYLYKPLLNEVPYPFILENGFFDKLIKGKLI